MRCASHMHRLLRENDVTSSYKPPIDRFLWFKTVELMNAKRSPEQMQLIKLM
jgi:hypothetical protein